MSKHVRSLLMVATFLAAGCLQTGSVVAADPPGQSTGGLAPLSESKSTAAQDPDWLSLKNAGRIGLDANRKPVVLASAPTTPAGSGAGLLSDSVTGWVVEPQGNLYDDHHAAFSDLNYWNFCAAGSAATALYYWKPSNLTSWPAGNFKEPYGPHVSTTYWKSADTGSSSDTSNGYATKGRAYLMYLAEQVKPPTYASAGIVNFTYYKTHGGTITDVRDALNWEASGHASNWQSYFYAFGRPTESQLHSDIVSDIVVAGVPVVASVDTKYLPNWSQSLDHAITIIGYDDFAGTYTYLDTCGRLCNGSAAAQNGGSNQISQHNLYLAVSSSKAEGIDW